VGSSSSVFEDKQFSIDGPSAIIFSGDGKAHREVKFCDEEAESIFIGVTRFAANDGFTDFISVYCAFIEFSKNLHIVYLY
jgi:hypothetical protein